MANSTQFEGIFYMPQICNTGTTALLPLRRKASWGFFRPEKSDGFSRVRTRELGYQRPACYPQTTEVACFVFTNLQIELHCWQLRLIHKASNRKPSFRGTDTDLGTLKVVLPKLPNTAFAIRKKHIRIWVQSLILSVDFIDSTVLLSRFSKNLSFCSKEFYFWEYITCCYGRKRLQFHLLPS
jgi:hypothetical protein